MTDNTTPEQLSLFDIEEWRPVVGYEGLYAVSNHGRVMRTKDSRHMGKGAINTARIRSGYWAVTLFSHGSRKSFSVHRLVARAFLGEPTARTVNHIDGNKLNNHADNLEYATYTENMRHAFKTGLYGNRKGENNNMSKLTRDQVDEIRYRYETENITQSELAKQYGMGSRGISDIITGRNWK